MLGNSFVEALILNTKTSLIKFVMILTEKISKYATLIDERKATQRSF